VDLVFICGSGHSGSTLLEMMLAGHPEVTAAGELQNLGHQLSIGRPCSCGCLPAQCRRWQAVAAAIRARCGVDIFESPFALRVSRERPRNPLESAIRRWSRLLHYVHYRSPLLGRLSLPRLAPGSQRLAANTQLVSQILREVSGARILVDSSKDYIRMRERYSAAPERTRVIYLFRDGRGVAWSSFKHARTPIARGARDWAKSQRRTRAMLAGVRPEDRRDVRYEELCADPAAVLRPLCAWLGLEYSDALVALAPREHHTIAGNKIRLQREMAVVADVVWRRKLTAAQLAAFEQVAGRENRRLGYGPA
jgi:hypothetical protein